MQNEADSLLRRHVMIRPFDNGDLSKVLIAAKGDNHSVIKPTDVIEKAGEIVGALEIGSTPQVLVWMDTQKTNVRDSLDILHYFNSIVARMGHRTYTLPCSSKSPYLPYLEKTGWYHNLGQFTLFLKKVT